MQRNTFLPIAVVLASIVPIGACRVAASATSLTVKVGVPAAARITGTLEFDVQLERWGPVPASPPEGFVQDGVIGDECVKRLQKDETYQRAVAKEGRAKAVAATLGAEGHWVDQTIEPGVYSLYVQAFDKQPGGRGRPAVSRKLWIISVSAGGKPVDLGRLELSAGKHLSVGDTAPEISGIRVDGKPFEPSSLKGKWRVVSFWATWCPPCLEELPKLAALQKAFPDVVLVGMCFDEDPAKPRQYCASKGYAWPNIRFGDMGSSPAREAWGIETVPQLFLIDPSGKVAAACASPGQLRAILERR
jgi:thiol-disulfide isomerase/thioredoxin